MLEVKDKLGQKERLGWQEMYPQDINRYLRALRWLMNDLKGLNDAKVDALLKKYQVNAVEVDGFQRVSVALPGDTDVLA